MHVIWSDIRCFGFIFPYQRKTYSYINLVLLHYDIYHSVEFMIFHQFPMLAKTKRNLCLLGYAIFKSTWIINIGNMRISGIEPSSITRYFWYSILCYTKSNIKIDKINFPSFYWLSKLHKNPYKSRLSFISNSSHCSTTILLSI